MIVHYLTVDVDDIRYNHTDFYWFHFDKTKNYYTFGTKNSHNDSKHFVYDLTNHINCVYLIGLNEIGRIIDWMRFDK